MTKISALTALTGAGVDTATDLIPIVDMSETGVLRNKKITVAELKLALGVTTYTDEQVRDVIAAALVAGSNLTITNDDAGDTITIDAAGGGLDAEAVMDLIASMITAGTNVSVTYDDASDTLTIASSGGGGGGGDLLAANNLSDVSSKVAAKDNISVKGSDIASGSTTDLSGATGDFVTITGTTTITAFGTCAAGVERTLHFSGALTLTHNATSLILPTGSNIVTTAGDVAVFRSRGSGNWRCVSYQRASGRPIAPFEGCKIYPSANFTPTVGSTTDLTVTHSEKFDTGNWHTAANPGRITFDFDGYVEAYAQLVRTANVTGAIALFIRHYNSGGTLLGTLCRNESDTGGGDQVNCASGPFHVTSGDYIHLSYFIDVAGTCDGGDYATWLSMRVLSRD